jgi:hypothetical protein
MNLIHDIKYHFPAPREARAIIKHEGEFFVLWGIDHHDNERFDSSDTARVISRAGGYKQFRYQYDAMEYYHRMIADCYRYLDDARQAQFAWERTLKRARI